MVLASKIAPQGPITQMGQKYAASPVATDVASQIATTIKPVVNQPLHIAATHRIVVPAGTGGCAPRMPARSICESVAGAVGGRSVSKPLRSPYVLAAYASLIRSSYSARSRRPSSRAARSLSATT